MATPIFAFSTGKLVTRSEAFEKLFSGLARQAPGMDEWTRFALRACRLEDAPEIVDLGCGTGASTLVLAEELSTPVIAIDRSEQALQTLRDRAQRRDIEELVDIRCGDIVEPDLEPGSFDVVWSEGAISVPGWEHGLETWGALLKPGGHLAVTDCNWKTPEPPAEAREFWDEAYPAMETAADHMATAFARGFEEVSVFRLPDEAWEEYYAPLRQRIALVQQSGSAAGPMREVADEIAHEIAIWDQYGESFGYTFYVLRKT